MDTTYTDVGHAESGQVVRLRVLGMDCGSCVAKVEAAASRLPGVGDVSANLMTETLTARIGPDGSDTEALAAAVSALGYKVSPLPSSDAAGPPSENDQAGHTGEDDDDALGVAWWRTGKARLAILLAILVGAAWSLAHAFPAVAYWLYLALTLLAVVPFGRRAVALARAGSPFSIETLMVTAALGAVIIGAAEEAAIVVLLFAVGELLEGVAAGRARAGIRALAGLMPRTARVERDGGAVLEVPAASLIVGEVVQVRPGDRVPCDGVVVDGQSTVDESPVTGESVPVARGPGEGMVAGSVNVDALLRVRVTAAAADNTVSRIVRLVEQAASSRAPTQRFIERFSRWWTPAAMLVSAAVMLVPPLLGGEWTTWVYRGLAVLLIACPCALVISVPAAVASALAAGARRGLLVKNGAALEAVGKARTVAFDKTGTLTEGKPRVTDVLPAEGTTVAALLRAAASVEAGSAHPLALAVVREAEAQGVAILHARAASAVPGRAAVANVDNVRTTVGSPTYAIERGVALEPFMSRIAALESDGKTSVVVFTRDRVLGVLALRDEPRGDAATTVAALKRMGVTAVMLTGDNERTGRAIAGALGMEVRAHLLPADKLLAIETWKASGPVVMVGDGINDAPALAAASVGIAMGGGTDVALETADAALLHGRVMGVAELIALSQATLANIRQNVGMAVALKAVFLVTTLAGVTGLWPAILADTGATVLVTLNALRLLRWRAGAIS